MTIPGVDAITAVAVVAAVGDFSRFRSPDRLVSYFGLNPKVRQSGNSAPVHGRSPRPAALRSVAYWWKRPGRLPARPARCERSTSGSKARRGMQIAIVATARKMSVLAWHLVTNEQDYAFARPSFVAFKRRKLELTAGMTSQRGNRRGAGYAYNDKDQRTAERALVEQAERQYAVLVNHWRPTGPRRET